VPWPKQGMPKVTVGSLSQRSISLLCAATLSLASHNVLASDRVALSLKQQEIIFDEANANYLKAIELVSDDAADAQERFEEAARKYQLLVDSGIHNSELYFNLGNAYLQSGELGRAIANYERARRLDPRNQQLLANLKSADAKVQLPPLPTSPTETTVVSSIMQRLRLANETIVQIVGEQTVAVTLVVSSVLFWSLLTVRTAGLRFPVIQYAAVPLLMLMASLGSMALSAAAHASRPNGVLVASRIRMHAGDGEQFDEVASIEAAQGHRVTILANRDKWTQILTDQGQLGWVPCDHVEGIAEPS
jgi:tetratricopeptide (TPR) repeat protein